jgi:hypothetical protein
MADAAFVTGGKKLHLSKFLTVLTRPSGTVSLERRKSGTRVVESAMF